MVDVGLTRTALAENPKRAGVLSVLAAAAIVAAVLLSLPLHLPAGAFYWDIYFFADAAERIRHDQVPHLDFFLSVGALPYYLYDLASRVWPQGHPLLLGQYSLLIVTLPLMAATVLSAQAGRGTLIALILPFAFFSLAPVNTEAFTPLPSVDGFGLYNREAGLLLFVLASALAFVRNKAALGSIVGLTLAALFFTKITGFVAGIGFAGAAFLAGRFGVRGTMAAALCVALPLLAAELSLGIVQAYLSDIVAMLSHNSGSFTERLLRLVSNKFDVLAPLAALWCVMVFVDIGRTGEVLARPGVSRITGTFGLSFVQFPIFVVSAIVFEMQNTGSQEFIYLWPFLLAVMTNARGISGRVGTALLALVVVASLPTFTKTVHRLVRAAAILPVQESLNLPELGVLDSISARADYIESARIMRAHFAENLGAYERLAAAEQEPSFIYYAQPGAQVLFLLDLAEAVNAIRRREAETGVRYRSLAGLDYVDPLPMLLGRTPARGMPMGLDPTRGYPVARHEDYRAGLREVDVILRPLCPLLPQRAQIAAIAKPVLAERTAVQIDPCWIAYETLGPANHTSHLSGKVDAILHDLGHSAAR